MKNHESCAGIATTEDWLKATEGMKINTFDATSLVLIQPSNSESNVFTKPDYENAISKVGQNTRSSKPEKEKM
jgi:hypothetical protein